jgi:hypothetical protein
LPVPNAVHRESSSHSAQAVAALSRPNVLAIFDFGRDGDTANAVMELLERTTDVKRSPTA